MTAMISHLQKHDKVLTRVRKKKEMTHKGSTIFVFPKPSPVMQMWREKLTIKKIGSLELKKNIYSRQIIFSFIQASMNYIQ